MIVSCAPFRVSFAGGGSAFVSSALRPFLIQHRTTRNGRPGSVPRPLSARQIVNVMECLRTMLHWPPSKAIGEPTAD